MTPCTAPRCRDAARWAVGPDDRQLCRRHMLDALLASGFGQAYAVPLEVEPVADQPEPVARLTAEERRLVVEALEQAERQLRTAAEGLRHDRDAIAPYSERVQAWRRLLDRLT